MTLPAHHAHVHGDRGHAHPHPTTPGRRLGRRTFLASLAIGFAALRLRARPKSAGDEPIDRSLAEAANQFLAALRPELRARYAFAFDDPYRKDWNNLPNFIHPRKGLRMGELNPGER
ncbi:MAG TPA: DUF3500 domain-containing protein, partial [Bryobacteraceae bacterium]|nr:DUF3500 domain-containing protein [Bryobacteraceae bacterium]